MKHKPDLIRAIVREIEITDHFINSTDSIETVYFGGGTPSLLNEEELICLIESIHKKFNVASDAEITLEANPDDVSEKQVLVWKRTGINRLSLGIQSFVDEELKQMQRAHDADQARLSIKILQQGGMANISTDLIFGVPGQTDESIIDHLRFLKQAEIPHVSCYALTVEEKTILHHRIKKQDFPDVDNEQQARQFLLIHDTLSSMGYEHYEISNYAMPGMRSRHNSSYWQGKPYLGFGPSAHAYDGKNIRRWNISNNVEYMQAMERNIPCYTTEQLSIEQQFNEHIMTRLRTKEGIHLLELMALFGEENKNKLTASSRSFILEGRLRIQEDCMILTEEGMLYADGIAASLFMD